MVGRLSEVRKYFLEKPQPRLQTLTPELITLGNLESFPPAGQFQHFLKNLEKLKNEPFALKVVQGSPRLQNPLFFFQNLFNKQPQTVTVFVDQQILEILNKKAISTLPTKHMEGQFLSTLFLVLKKDRPSNSHKFKKANQHIRYEHLKMEGLSLFKSYRKWIVCAK